MLKSVEAGDSRSSRCEMSLVLTCEHGGNSIPKEFSSHFHHAQDALISHRGYDPGALELAKEFAREFEAPLLFETRSRLLIELNRTLGHPRIFSEFSRRLPAAEKERLIAEIYHPYRQSVIDQVSTLLKQGPVLHLSVHSFTPVMKEKFRRTDVGILFDPASSLEAAFAKKWKASLRRTFPELKIEFNMPYRGTSDGLTTALRKAFAGKIYAGIELEVNQKFPLEGGVDWERLMSGITRSLRPCLALSQAGSSLPAEKE